MTYGHVLKLAQAIADQEGFGVPGARPARNHNPGDLRDWPGYPADDGGFTVFPDDATGWDKLREDLANHAARWPGQSLQMFIAGNGRPAGTAECWPGYAPASDANDPLAYAMALAAALGCSVETVFSAL